MVLKRVFYSRQQSAVMRNKIRKSPDNSERKEEVNFINSVNSFTWKGYPQREKQIKSTTHHFHCQTSDVSAV